jgi:hypothetical protein
MTAPATERGFDWEAAGQGLGESLNLHHAIVVAGHNPDQTGQVALGIARTQSLHRRVTLGDLFADSPPIQRLVQDDDGHGLVNHLHGISLARVTRPVAGSTCLFVIRWFRAAGLRRTVLESAVGACHLEARARLSSHPRRAGRGAIAALVARPTAPL